MGIDADHMSVEGLAQSIPPVFAMYVIGQLIARLCSERWGVPLYSFKEGQEAEAQAALASRVGNLLEFTEHATATEYFQSLHYWPEHRLPGASAVLSQPGERRIGEMNASLHR